MTNGILKYHFHPAKGWLNDPNGLCRFGEYYHIFYQHAPGHEVPWAEPMVWGHARTKDFLNFEELPVALVSDKSYDCKGVWSGTAAEKDGVLYVFYASVAEGIRQTVSVATSRDGLHFEKYEDNPVISSYPADGSENFRDPAILLGKERNYLVIASADVKKGTGNLLLYVSSDLLHWEYSGVLYEYADCKFCECPSFVPSGDGYLLSCSVVKKDNSHYFEVLYGSFDGKKFTPEAVSHFQKGPHEYAGQIFHDGSKGRNIMMSWVSGWDIRPVEKCVGCLSLPLEIRVSGGEITAFPIEEVRHLVEKDGTVTDGYVKESYLDGGREVRIELTEIPFTPAD